MDEAGNKDDIEEKEEPKDEGEDPKEIARAMFIEGYDRPDIIDEIVETTGLDKRVIWALKGALAKSKAIPTKKEIEERQIKAREKEKFSDEVEVDDTDEREGGVPFRRPRPAYLILRTVLQEFGVKDRAIEIITTRCRRQGEMHPTEVQQHLSKIESGIKRSEADYIADEYFFALQHEQEKAEDYEGGRGGVGSYPSRRPADSGYSSPRGHGSSPSREREDYSYPKRQSSGGRPWERGGGGGQAPMTEERLTEMLDRRDHEFEERLRRTRLEDNVSDMGKQMVKMTEELIHLRDNPPSTIPADMITAEDLKAMKADSYQQALELQLTTMKDDRKELMDVLKDERKDSKERDKDLREFYDKKISKMEDKLESSKRDRPTSTDGYKDDNVRLAAQGLEAVASVVDKKEPVKVIIEGLGRMAQAGQPQPQTEPLQNRPKPEGEEEITSLIPSEYLED
ncbi:hypothetical protein ES703_14356 [subsurface metagenome]